MPSPTSTACLTRPPPWWRRESSGWVATCWVVVVSTAAWAAPTGYLPSIGPAPVRYQPPAPPANPGRLPPLAMTESTNAPAYVAPPVTTISHSSKTASSSNVTSMTNAESLLVPPSLGPVASEEETWSEAISNPFLVSPFSTAPLVTPQMLLEFFKPGNTNNNFSPGFHVPVFIPPLPPSSAPSSRAIYRSQ